GLLDHDIRSGDTRSGPLAAGRGDVVRPRAAGYVLSDTALTAGRSPGPDGAGPNGRWCSGLPVLLCPGAQFPEILAQAHPDGDYGSGRNTKPCGDVVGEEHRCLLRSSLVSVFAGIKLVRASGM